MKKTGKDRLN